MRFVIPNGKYVLNIRKSIHRIEQQKRIIAGSTLFCLIVEGLYTQCRGRAPASGQNAPAGGGEGLPLVA